ncbi:DMT family transporter [Desulfospira joergensenii]|uniref:DMT family transporter n=1 Tax=Desulfospira joergensenii TaxID=53329 RepID=UPI0003B37AE8|nr:EamA family transporter [Desulfospira joergensenii]
MTYIKLVLTAFFWGGTFIAGKGLANHIDPYSAAFFRFLIASLFLIFLTFRMEGGLPRIGIRQGVNVLLLGMTGVFSYNVLFFTGLSFINANRASLIIATNPIFISLFSALIFKESLTPLKITGLCLSVAGAMVIISNGNPALILESGLGRGEAAIFGCVLSWVAYSLLGKPLMKDLSPMASVCYSSIAGTVLLFFPALAHNIFSNAPGYTLGQWGSLFYLGFFGTVLGFFWYYQAILEIGPMKAGVFINFVPVSAIILAWLILGETLTPASLTGGILVISGVYLTNAGETIKKLILGKKD